MNEKITDSKIRTLKREISELKEQLDIFRGKENFLIKFDHAELRRRFESFKENFRGDSFA